MQGRIKKKTNPFCWRQRCWQRCRSTAGSTLKINKGTLKWTLKEAHTCFYWSLGEKHNSFRWNSQQLPGEMEKKLCFVIKAWIEIACYKKENHSQECKWASELTKGPKASGHTVCVTSFLPCITMMAWEGRASSSLQIGYFYMLILM